MGNHRLDIAGKTIRLHGSIVQPDFRKARVLCSDPWDFVSLWLKKKHKTNALFYWDQARHFFHASKDLPALSSPLTSYYCFLNATKALLASKGYEFKESHGIGGSTLDGQTSLQNEAVDFQGAGILPELCHLLLEPDNAGKRLSLQDLLWQMPFIHRAYCLSFTSATELYIPLLNNCFIRKDGSKEAWFQAEIDKRYLNAHTKKVIRPGFELHEIDGKNIIRRKRRFKWSGREIENSLTQFSIYHKQIRRRIIPIYGSENRWYLKKSVAGHDKVVNSQIVLIYAAMHRLSELSRYNPTRLAKHFEVNHNWMLTEFIKTAPGQFIYGMASEITGLEFIKPDAFN
jgi:hypothetical protein